MNHLTNCFSPLQYTATTFLVLELNVWIHEGERFLETRLSAFSTVKSPTSCLTCFCWIHNRFRSFIHHVSFSSSCDARPPIDSVYNRLQRHFIFRVCGSLSVCSGRLSQVGCPFTSLNAKRSNEYQTCLLLFISSLTHYHLSQFESYL